MPHPGPCSFKGRACRVNVAFGFVQSCACLLQFSLRYFLALLQTRTRRLHGTPNCIEGCIDAPKDLFIESLADGGRIQLQV